MKNQHHPLFISSLIILFTIFQSLSVLSCSTFKLQKGNKLVYGHNLNEGDIGVPGLIFINKRGIFKKGITWSELITKDQENPSDFSWISRFGSVTFNLFGKDLPDGGMNETGLYIWEMNEDAEYPKKEDLPKLNQMSWMQYILDNLSSTEEVIQSAYGFEIDGWTWHYFVGDAQGNCAAIEFFNGEVVITKGDEMSVPALFNAPYHRELEIMKYYNGFGGTYDTKLDDPEVPRFVKTAVLIDQYQLNDNIVDYGLKMLDQLMVSDVPEWSVLFDAKMQTVYFKSRLNPSLKQFSFRDIDFSNDSPAQILNLDISEKGDVQDQFVAYSHQIFKSFTKEFVFPILPEEFFTYGGISLEEYLKRITDCSDWSNNPDNQFYNGNWAVKADSEEGLSINLTLESLGNAVKGKISISDPIDVYYTIDHLKMYGSNISFTFKTKYRTFFEMKGKIVEDEMILQLYSAEDKYSKYRLHKY